MYICRVWIEGCDLSVKYRYECDVGKLRILKIWVNKMSKWINCTYELKSETLCMHYLYESKLASLGL